MGFGSLGGPELLLIVLALVLIFGASKLGDIGGALGKSIREFKKASAEDAPVPAQPLAPVAETPAAVGAASRPSIRDDRPAVPEYHPAKANSEYRPPASSEAVVAADQSPRA